MRYYLSGPMRGLLGYNFTAFNAAASVLREMGHEVVNPAEDESGKALDPEKEYTQDQINAFFRYDVSAILNVDAIVVLDNWIYSQGANLEVVIAKMIGLPILKFSGQQELWGNLIPEDAINPVEIASETVRITMGKGLGKHAADSWRDEPLQNHTLKCARHALTAQLQADGLSPLDGENHLENAICRAVMALAKTKEKK